MPPKKATAAASQKKTAAGPSHASYKDMIKEAILTLKERNGSSRPAIKKYIQANNKIPAVSSAAFDSQFNKAIRTGVDKGDFEQPKGSSGTIKLAKKTAPEKPAADKKPAAPKKAAAAKSPGRPKKITTDAAAPKKTATKAKAAAPKKAPATKKAAAPKPKANTASKRKTPAPAPAIVEQEKVLGKTKSGRVTKGPAKAAGPAKKAAPKKAAAAKKSATPKKKAEAAAAAT